MAFCELNYFSEPLGRHEVAWVLLPESGEAPFPVLYLLHGLSDNHTMWMRRSNVERHAAETPFVVVMPDGGRGFYLDAHAGDRYGAAIAEDLPQRIERTFPVRLDRDGRCIAGLSMGGYGSLRIALTHPERYAAAVSMSGAVNFGHRHMDEASHQFTAEFKRLLGPDHIGGPNDLWALAENVDRDTLPALRIDCGVGDHLLDDNRQFHAHLDQFGIPHEYHEYPGGHDWDYWDQHVQDAIAFCRRTIGV